MYRKERTSRGRSVLIDAYPQNSRQNASDRVLHQIHFNCTMTVPSEIVGRATPVLLAFLAIHSRAAPRPRTLRGWCARGNSSQNPLPPNETFHFSFVLHQQVEKRLRAFARIVSDDSMHDTPPTADILPVNARHQRHAAAAEFQSGLFQPHHVSH